MSTIFQSALRTVDAGLENVSLLADAATRVSAPVPPVTSDFNEHAPESYISKSIEGLRSQVQRGFPIDRPPLELISSVIDAVASANQLTDGLDDRKLALEEALVFLSRAPPSNAVNNAMHAAIRLLYRDLPHPPSTNMGEYWQFRSADGSGNSRLEPDMGKAGTPYSRSCSSTAALSESELPDPGLIFDLLIKREEFKPHPAGLSGLFFNFATSVIHSVFRTSRTDWNINETSSYVDMGILYGNTQGHQDKMRVVDGYGKILPDCFAETRLVNLPPGVSALIICFNRNHNWLADMLLRINERGRWNQDIEALKKSADPKAVEKQDYEIFNTARLINSLTYANVVLGDYLAAILGTVRDLSSWTLDITSERRESDHTLLERGTGNSCSVEFNTLYRLHPSMSEQDEAYTQKQFQWVFETTDWDSITPEIFEAQLVVKVLTAADPGAHPNSLDEYFALSADDRNKLLYQVDGAPRDYIQVPWGQAKRDPKTLRYADADLAKALQDATSVPAAAFKARGVPHVMRVIEILGIQQARNWGCCSLNDFRRFLGLKPYSTFEEWNPDQKIADAARKLYRNPENLELYVGLVAEQSKDVGPGAGLCPSYTMSRAILADAVALVRGDRYLTYDCTPFNLTPFGFTEGSRNINNAAHGGMLGKIIARALPNHYNDSSVYTHFPLITPTGQRYSMDKVLATRGVLDKYSIDKPVPQLPTQVVVDAKVIGQILGFIGTTGTAAFATPYLQNIKDVKLDKGFLAVIDDFVSYNKATTLLKQIVFNSPAALSRTLGWFHDRTLELIREKNLTLADPSKHTVDLVKDVLRLVPVHWSSSQVAGLPLKTVFEPRGVYYEQQAFDMLKDIYTFVYTDVDKTLKIPLRDDAKEDAERLLRFIEISVTEAKGGITGSVLSAAQYLVQGNTGEQNNAILKRFADLKSPVGETATDILSLISTASLELSQIYSHIINFFLAPTEPPKYGNDQAQLAAQREIYRDKSVLQEKIIALAVNYSSESQTLLEGYAREALRLDPAIPGVYRVAKADVSIGDVQFVKGQRVYLDLAAIGRDQGTFTDPLEVIPTRSPALYQFLHGDSVFKTLGEDFVYGSAAGVLRAVFTLKNVRRAPGPQGTLRRFKEGLHTPFDTVTYQDGNYTVTPGEGPRPEMWSYLDPEDANRVTHWATGLTILYDD